MVVCKFFAQGECRYGENCKFEHQFPSAEVNGTQQFKNRSNHNKGSNSKPNIDDDSLISAVRNDMISIEKSGQWILTCYAPFKEKPLFPGFQDESFEEVRFGCYEAQKLNTFEQYKQQLQLALSGARNNFKALQNPTKEIVEILKNIYNTPVPASNSSDNSIFGNTPSFGTSAQNMFAQNPTTNRDAVGSVFGQSQSANIFGQQNRTQNSGTIFGQQNVVSQNSGTIFSQQNVSQNSRFGQQTENNTNLLQQGPPNATSIFSNANQNIFSGSQATHDKQNLFATLPMNSPQQGSTFQQLQKQTLFPNNTQTQANQSIFSSNVVGMQQGGLPLNWAVNQIDSPASQNYFKSQNSQAFSQVHQTNDMNPLLNSQSNETGTIFNTGSQSKPKESIFGKSMQATSSNNCGNIFGSGSIMINHDAYSKIEDLSETDIHWFNNNDLDIQNMPVKPPTYEMCFS